MAFANDRPSGNELYLPAFGNDHLHPEVVPVFKTVR